MIYLKVIYTQKNTKISQKTNLTLKALKMMYLREAQIKLRPETVAKPQIEEKPKLSDLEFVEREIQHDKKPPGAPNITEDELINKAKIQVERLIKSFNLLINNQRSKRENISYSRIEFERNHLSFNKSIKAYVDVCCNSPGLVSPNLYF